MRTSPAGTDPGFSLAELLVVLAIISMVVAITPTFYRMTVPSARYTQSATELVAYLREARSVATRSSKSISLSIEEARITSAHPDVGEFDGPGDATLKFVPEFSDQTQEDVPLTFYPGGGSTGGVLTLLGDERREQISINWLTGHVRLVR